jgi:protein disulfide-isomerase A4
MSFYQPNLKSNKFYIFYYNSSCGHCIRLAPNYEKAARILSEEAAPIPLAKVDASVEQELSEQYKITGYPTLFVFRKGRHYKYKGGREVDGKKKKKLFN